MPPAIWVICAVGSAPAASLRKPVPKIPPTTARIRIVNAIHIKNCVNATMATPIIFPKSSSVAFTEETSTSTTRLDFSSMTLDITIPQNMEMNI
ncbi:unknown [Bacteroides sp. CAG:770]|nr:unknown [Bacteroides sp. CAG:770]